MCMCVYVYVYEHVYVYVYVHVYVYMYVYGYMHTKHLNDRQVVTNTKYGGSDLFDKCCWYSSGPKLHI